VAAVGGEQAPADPGDDRHGDGVADGAVAGGVGDWPTVGVQRGPVVGEALEAFALARGEPPDGDRRRIAATAGLPRNVAVRAGCNLAVRGVDGHAVVVVDGGVAALVGTGLGPGHNGGMLDDIRHWRWLAGRGGRPRCGVVKVAFGLRHPDHDGRVALAGLAAAGVQAGRDVGGQDLAALVFGDRARLERRRGAGRRVWCRLGAGGQVEQVRVAGVQGVAGPRFGQPDVAEAGARPGWCTAAPSPRRGRLPPGGGRSDAAECPVQGGR
jgi:hypothetical protein